jgi:hypothetical protein
MLSKLAIAAGGAVLAAALGAPVAAQASVSSFATTNTKAASALPDGLVEQGCGQIWDGGIGEYATTDLDTGQVIFKPLSFFATADPSTWLVGVNSSGGGVPPNYCNVSVTSAPGSFEIWDPVSYGCLAADTASGANAQVHEDTASACLDVVYAWDEWTATAVGSYHSNTLWQLRNSYVADEGGCLYDYKQPTAVYTTTGCSGTDIYEQFSWTGSNL